MNYPALSSENRLKAVKGCKSYAINPFLIPTLSVKIAKILKVTIFTSFTYQHNEIVFPAEVQLVVLRELLIFITLNRLDLDNNIMRNRLIR